MARVTIIARVLELAKESLEDDLDDSDIELLAVESDSSHRPNLSLLHPKIGLIAIEIGRSGESESEIRTRLNVKVQGLLREAPYLDNLDVNRLSIVTGSGQDAKRIGSQAVLIGEKSLGTFDWATEFVSETRQNFEFHRLSLLLNPRFVIEIPTYGGVEDRGREERDALRIQLDAEQSEIAARNIRDVLVVSGGPGTGKTMVLIGRAKWLAQQHPDWKILLVVYNNMLSKHLQAIPDMPKTVKVMTLQRFLESRGARSLSKLLMDFDNPLGAEEHAARIVRSLKPTAADIDIDALLVDEWQDFRAPYIKYLLGLVRKGGGGSMFAGDEKQAIYTHGCPEPFANRQVEMEKLKRPYRSTQQILKVAMALDKKYKVDNVEQAPSGEPVTTIFAPHWSLQGEVIAIEIETLLKKGDFEPGGIAVLCTTKSGANHVATALSSKSIPFRLLTKFWEEPQPGGDEVNIMTVHGSKGFGFKVVFIHGFETLKDKNGTPENEKWRRVGFVGATRAEDLLYLLYKTQTQFVTSVLDLAKKEKGVVVGRIFPDDYKKHR